MQFSRGQITAIRALPVHVGEISAHTAEAARTALSWLRGPELQGVARTTKLDDSPMAEQIYKCFIKFMLEAGHNPGPQGIYKKYGKSCARPFNQQPVRATTSRSPVQLPGLMEAKRNAELEKTSLLVAQRAASSIRAENALRNSASVWPPPMPLHFPAEVARSLKFVKANGGGFKYLMWKRSSGTEVQVDPSKRWSEQQIRNGDMAKDIWARKHPPFDGPAPVEFPNGYVPVHWKKIGKSQTLFYNTFKDAFNLPPLPVRNSNSHKTVQLSRATDHGSWCFVAFATPPPFPPVFNTLPISSSRIITQF